MPQMIGVLAPVGRDAHVIVEIVGKAGVVAVAFAEAADLVGALSAGRVGTAIIAEEALTSPGLDSIAAWLKRQPPWSDLPVILLTKRGGNVFRQDQIARALGNVTILERPLSPVILVSAARSALRARARQHEAEAYIAELAAREQELTEERARLSASEARLKDANALLNQRFADALAEKAVLADIVEGTDAFVQVVDMNYRWLAINRASKDEFERIFGIRPELGQSMLDVLAHMPEHREAVRAVWERALSGEEFTEVQEFGDTARDRRFYEMKFNALRNQEGRRIGAYQFVYDVTDRVRSQQELVEAQARVHEMAKMETLGQLTGGVAHDFNNLLTPIVGALDALRRHHESDTRSGRLVSGALEAAERAALLVQRLLSFARRQDLQARNVDVGELIGGLKDLIQRSIGPHIQVRVNVQGGLQPARIDPNQLELAILNLAVNAADAMPNGGALAIDVAERSVATGEVDDLKAGQFICLSVKDTGSGMDEATIRRCIEPFFTTKGVGKGTGLGLSMVHGLAAQSGGMLRLHSVVGQGTTAEIWLPVSEQAPDALNNAGEEPEYRTPPLVILLVDDEKLVRRAVAQMLRDLGHEVLEASSLSGAMSELAARPDIALMISDDLMPGMLGSELIGRARQLRPGLRGLLITGHAGLTEDRDIAKLSKPFRTGDLAREIAKLMDDPDSADHESERQAV